MGSTDELGPRLFGKGMMGVRILLRNMDKLMKTFNLIKYGFLSKRCHILWRHYLVRVLKYFQVDDIGKLICWCLSWFI